MSLPKVKGVLRRFCASTSECICFISLVIAAVVLLQYLAYATYNFKNMWQLIAWNITLQTGANTLLIAYLTYKILKNKNLSFFKLIILSTIFTLITYFAHENVSDILNAIINIILFYWVLYLCAGYKILSSLERGCIILIKNPAETITVLILMIIFSKIQYTLCNNIILITDWREGTFYSLSLLSSYLSVMVAFSNFYHYKKVLIN